MSFDLPALPEGWTYLPLDRCAVPGSISYGVVQQGSPLNDGVPIIRVNNFSDTRLDLSDVMYIAPEVEAKYGRTRLTGGEVLLTLVGSVGRVAESTAIITRTRILAIVALMEKAGLGNRATCTKYLRALVAAGLLREQAVWRENYYINDRFFDALVG